MHKIYALHGFLGKPSDWESIFSIHPLKNSSYAVDLFRTSALPPFSRAHELVKAESGPKVLLGYSLGGRIAFHILQNQMHFWDAAIIVSSHPGISCEKEKTLRLQNDLQWGTRFANEPWDVLMRDWNRQQIFQTSGHTFARDEKDFKREILQRSLTTYSLGRQADFRPWLKTADIPILWMTGTNDIKYCQIANTVELKHPLSSKVVIPHAGHRTPWDNPSRFLDSVQSFLNSL